MSLPKKHPGMGDHWWWSPDCCPNGYEHISHWQDPKKPGWSLDIDIDDRDEIPPDISFCPWCGSPVPDESSFEGIVA